MGAIEKLVDYINGMGISIPAMGAIGIGFRQYRATFVSIPAMGAIDQDYVGRFHYNRKR